MGDDALWFCGHRLAASPHAPHGRDRSARLNPRPQLERRLLIGRSPLLLRAPKRRIGQVRLILSLPYWTPDDRSSGKRLHSGCLGRTVSSYGRVSNGTRLLTEPCEATINPGLFLSGKEVIVKRSARLLAGMLVDLPPDRLRHSATSTVTALQRCVGSRTSDAVETKHGLVETRVTRIHFDKQVGAGIMHRSVDEDDVKEATEARPCRAGRIESEFRQLAQLRSRRLA